jgi:hypothetical protein
LRPSLYPTSSLHASVQEIVKTVRFSSVIP